jgi:hypothetical protein
MSSSPRVVIVILRQPSSAISERRDDPFWEFGSFGCTGCHSRNLMHPKRAHELNGARLAFVQGGPLGFRLVHVTEEIWMKPLGADFEARWPTGQMPLAYCSAPLVVDNEGKSDIPKLAMETHSIARSTPVARFASAFRSRRLPVAGEVGAAIVACYQRHRTHGGEAKSYIDAMPRTPAIIEPNRKRRYEELIKKRKAFSTAGSCRVNSRRKAKPDKHRCELGAEPFNVGIRNR